jgi:hypothetical protein
VSSALLGPKIRFLLLSDSCRFVNVETFSDKRTGLSFTIAAGHRQRSHPRVRVPRDSTVFFCPKFETPPTWRASSSYLCPPGTGWPSYTLRRWITFHLLRLAGLRWRYLTASARIQSRTPLRIIPQCCVLIVATLTWCFITSAVEISQARNLNINS